MSTTTAIQIQQLTGITPEQYAQEVWTGALEYCRWYCYGDELSTDSLMLTRSFWRWWRGVWEQIDLQFISQYSRYTHLTEHEYMTGLWLAAHKVECIVSTPNEEIVTECCKIMKQRFVKL